MLLIRSQQMEAFRTAIHEQFLREFRASFAAEFTEFLDDLTTFEERSRSALARKRQTIRRVGGNVRTDLPGARSPSCRRESR